jgi:SAM-dependent methyltransferase
MGLLGGSVGLRILQSISPDGSGGLSSDTPAVYSNKSKLEMLIGAGFWEEIRGRVVMDFGCGEGHEVVEMAERGARQVIGIDTRQKWLDRASELAQKRGVADRCLFVQRWTRPAVADVIVSLDSFEHFDDPAEILALMSRILNPNGRVVACFGPTWYHPYGGHLFSVFPWAHLVFSENAMVTWRSGLPGKGRTKSLREAGLNKMTVRRFERLIEHSPLRVESFEAVPIRRLKWLANRVSREFTTSAVRCRLAPREASRGASVIDETATPTQIIA